MEAAASYPDPQGAHGEPCEECGAPLAEDQRYCLNCGHRRAGPRVDYGAYMTPTAQPQAEAAVADEKEGEQDPSRSERDLAPFAAVAGIALLGLMLLVGVMIGKGDSPTQSSAPAPIVRVSGAPDEDQATEAGATATKGGAANSKAPATGAATVDGGLTGAAARKSDETVQATTDDLESLAESTGEDYEETVKKLPDKIATPGAPPPIDKSKAPGGGGKAEAIE